MRLFERGPVVDVVFGVGLIGAAVCEGIRRLPGPPVARDSVLASDWAGAFGVAESLKAAEGWIAAAPGVQRARVFWCAGRGGFASTGAALRSELDAFNAVVRWSEGLAGRLALEFHMLSSAGGIHEGQLRVDRAAPTAQLRPYAQLKLSQERALEAAQLPRKHVYRPSSVYGVPRRQQRLGMVPTMVLNALRRRPSTISAHVSTLRDYVSAHDVGAYVAAEGDKPGLCYLVMGRPTSIFSLQLAVERYLQRQVAVVFTLAKDNSGSITFSPRLMAPGWRPSTVESNLARIVTALQSLTV